MWLKHERSLAEEGKYSEVRGFIAGTSIALMYGHGSWLWQEGVNPFSLTGINMAFVMMPLYAFGLGALGAFIGHTAARFRNHSCPK
ncbi:hypothetical protein [Lacimicrobium sp. SS2-24]|uniref:hypothetical protein n=1 Tax=Lacimicrobium sp. SS2-24 TaxID=2005569 RepID=UPI001131FCA0|nr:hypothetical protein [Lacimicrobium sp. SS2-24]